MVAFTRSDECLTDVSTWSKVSFCARSECVKEILHTELSHAGINIILVTKDRPNFEPCNGTSSCTGKVVIACCDLQKGATVA